MAPFDNFDESALGAFMESTLGVRGTGFRFYLVGNYASGRNIFYMDSDFNVLSYIAAGDNNLYGVAVDGQGHVLVSGVHDSSSKNTWYLDSDGDVVWSYQAGTVTANAYGCAFDGDGDALVCGTYTPADGGSGAVVEKVNSSGAQVWEWNNGGGVGVAVAVDAGGNVYVLWTTGAGNVWITKLDEDGNHEWTVDPGFPAAVDLSCSIAIEAGGGVYVSVNFTTGGPDSLYCLDPSDGSADWSIVNPPPNGSYGCAKAPDNGVVVVGKLYDSKYVWKFALSDGSTDWSLAPTSAATCTAGAIEQGSGEIVVASSGKLCRISADGTELDYKVAGPGVPRGMAIDAGGLVAELAEA